jgi:hypothetical protein
LTTRLKGRVVVAALAFGCGSEAVHNLRGRRSQRHLSIQL